MRQTVRHMKEILVVANRTLGGAQLLEAVRRHAAEPGGAQLPAGGAAEHTRRPAS